MKDTAKSSKKTRGAQVSHTLQCFNTSSPNTLSLNATMQSRKTFTFPPWRPSSRASMTCRGRGMHSADERVWGQSVRFLHRRGKRGEAGSESLVP
ncbi:hypothetical protein E2C01_049610 [Portunus trituberculatus]|uniref:Uncharacterized protein n=1 Tax=Portunus trituberculatus TaxID=210409 RepID=A0A5B7GEU3_PORTR|nr:hypothetical protein [Portunus trituberculatus]